MRKLGWGVAIALAALGLWRCLRPLAPAESGAGNVSGWTLRIGHAEGEGSPIHAGALRFAKAAAEISGGRLDVRVEHGQRWRDRPSVERAAKEDRVHIMVLPAGPLSSCVPEIDILSSPFLFPTRAICHEMLDGEPGRLLLERLDRVGLSGLAFWDGSFREISADRELRTPEAMRHLRVGIPGGSRGEGLLRALGSHPVPVPLGRLREEWGSFSVNAVDLTPSLLLEAGLGSVQSHLILLDHAYLGQVVCIPRRALGRIPPDLQETIRTAVLQATTFEREAAREHEEGVLRAVERDGVRVVRLDEPERRRFWEAARVLDDRKEGAPGAEILERALEMRDRLLRERGR